MANAYLGVRRAQVKTGGIYGKITGFSHMCTAFPGDDGDKPISYSHVTLHGECISWGYGVSALFRGVLPTEIKRFSHVYMMETNQWYHVIAPSMVHVYLLLRGLQHQTGGS